MNALKLLANQQTDGDSPIQSIVTGLHERSRRGIMDGLRSFVEVDKTQCRGRGWRATWYQIDSCEETSSSESSTDGRASFLLH